MGIYERQGQISAGFKIKHKHSNLTAEIACIVTRFTAEVPHLDHRRRVPAHSSDWTTSGNPC